MRFFSGHRTVPDITPTMHVLPVNLINTRVGPRLRLRDGAAKADHA